jgi:hypothetical protein
MRLDARIVACVEAQADARQLGARRTGLNAPLLYARKDPLISRLQMIAPSACDTDHRGVVVRIPIAI